MIDKIHWGTIFVLGFMLLLSALSPPRPGGRWYLRLLIGISGIFLLYASGHWFLLKLK